MKQALNKYNFRFSCKDLSHRAVSPLVVLIAGQSSCAQNIATGSATIPAAGRADAAAPRAAAQPPRPAEVINYETIHLEKRSRRCSAIGAITPDGALDEQVVERSADRERLHPE